MICTLVRNGTLPTLIGCVFALAVLASAFPVLAPMLTEAFIYGTMVVGLQIFVGNSGVVSFGHISFALVGAYATAWQTCCSGIRQVFLPGLPDWLAAIDVPPIIAFSNTVLLAGALALVVGVVLMRLTGVAASIALLSFLFMVKTIYENWAGWTSGQSSLVGLPLVVTPTLAATALSLVILSAFAYNRSPSALRLRAARDDEPAAQACGVWIWRERLIAFVLSAMIVALGGALLAHYLGSISVSLYWLDMTFLTLAMLIIGGRGGVTGALAGTMLVTGLRDVLRLLERGVEAPWAQLTLPEGTQEIALALLLLTVLVVRPGGLLADYEFNLPRILHHALKKNA